MNIFKWIPQTVLQILFAAALSGALHLFHFYVLEFWLMDIKFRIGPQTPPSGKIVLVGVDAKSITALNGDVTFEHHAKLLDRIKTSNPLAVAYLMNLNTVNGADSDKLDFVNTSKELTEFLVGIDEVPVKGELKKYVLAPPLDALRVMPGVYTADTTTFAEDDVSRRTLLWYEDYEYIFPYLANKITEKTWKEYRGQFDVSTSKQVHTDFRRPGSYPIVSLSDVLNGQTDPSVFNGKIVLVGTISQDLNDNLKSPYSRDRYKMSMLEAKANNIDTLITDTSILHTT